jgi:hypothetical protein
MPLLARQMQWREQSIVCSANVLAVSNQAGYLLRPTIDRSLMKADAPIAISTHLLGHAVGIGGRLRWLSDLSGFVLQVTFPDAGPCLRLPGRGRYLVDDVSD